MKKSTLIKSLFEVGLLILFALLYWSSILIEEDIKAMRLEMKQLKFDLSRLGQKIDSSKLSEVKKNSFQTNATFSNILQEDPYFAKILPNLIGEDFEPKGVVKEAMISQPDNLHPFNPFWNVFQLYSLCTVRLGDHTFGKYETLASDMALRIEARPRNDLPDTQEYWVFLREDVYWHPLNPAHFPSSLKLDPHFFEKHPVTSYDFKFAYDAVMNPYVSEGKAVALRTYFVDIEEFKVIDEYTFVIRWKPYETPNHEMKVKYTSLNLMAGLQPLPCFVYQYFADGIKIIEDSSDKDVYQKNSIWAQNFSQHWAKNVIVSCGPYLFDGMNDEGIQLKRNPDYYNPYKVLVEGIYYRFKESTDAIWQDFKTGKVDLCHLASNQLPELERFLGSEEYAQQKAQGDEIKFIDYVDLSFYYLGWNTIKPFFSNPKLRKAMTLAIDRKRIIEQNLNDMAIHINGPFFRYSPSYDETIPLPPFNPDEACALLDAEDWIDSDGDGVREKFIDGQKVLFQFKLFYFVKNLSSKIIAEYISSALREVGVECQLAGLDLADLSRQFHDKSFDAIFMGWKIGFPPEDPSPIWHSTGAKKKGSPNAIGFASPEIDAIIESLNYEYDIEKRLLLYHKFHREIDQEAPYTFLYTPKIRLLYREYIKNIFIPRERDDLIPGANISEPNIELIWIEK
ncbi:MAG: ABC transporter substrate-binding protein [Chlamydiales bacterium]